MLWHAGVITTMICRGNRSQSASHSSMTPARLSATEPLGWSKQRRVWLRMIMPLGIVVPAFFYPDALFKQQKYVQLQVRILDISRLQGRSKDLPSCSISEAWFLDKECRKRHTILTNLHRKLSLGIQMTRSTARLLSTRQAACPRLNVVLLSAFSFILCISFHYQGLFLPHFVVTNLRSTVFYFMHSIFPMGFSSTYYMDLNVIGTDRGRQEMCRTKRRK